MIITLKTKYFNHYAHLHKNNMTYHPYSQNLEYMFLCIILATTYVWLISMEKIMFDISGINHTMNIINI